MTIEEKAKAYDEALERAKDCLTNKKFKNIDDTPEDLTTYIFPQLAESEDERIRKELIDFVNHYRHNTDLTSEQAEWCKKALAYLEKQKDHFRDDTKMVEQKAYLNTDYFKSFMLQYLQDAANKKDDSEIEAATNYWMEKLLGLTKWQKEQKPVDFPTTDEEVKEFLETHPKVEVPEKYKTPDFVFSKQEYESHPIISKDTTSVKPAEWSEDDKSFYDSIMCEVVKEGMHPTPEQANWLKTLPERFNIEPKQEQNDYITPHKEFFKFIYDRLINVHKENPNVDYMRSFKERLNNLSFEEKQEWSEEDEENLELVTDCVYNFYPDPVMKYKLKDWLKSLRPQPHWKPSEEQVQALEYVVSSIPPNFLKEQEYMMALINQVIQQLKKMM